TASIETTSTSVRPSRPCVIQARPTPQPVPSSRIRPSTGTAAASTASSRPTSGAHDRRKPASVARAVAASTRAGNMLRDLGGRPATGGTDFLYPRRVSVTERLPPEPGPEPEPVSPARPTPPAVHRGAPAPKPSVRAPRGGAPGDRVRTKPPSPSPPRVLIRELDRLTHELPPWDRVSVGFPGFVRAG